MVWSAVVVLSSASGGGEERGMYHFDRRVSFDPRNCMPKTGQEKSPLRKSREGKLELNNFRFENVYLVIGNYTKNL